jgi:hypothetical protein
MDRNRLHPIRREVACSLMKFPTSFDPIVGRRSWPCGTALVGSRNVKLVLGTSCHRNSTLHLVAKINNSVINVFIVLWLCDFLVPFPCPGVDNRASRNPICVSLFSRFQNTYFFRIYAKLTITPNIVIAI